MKKIYFCLTLFLLSAIPSLSQSMQTTYFMDNNMYSYRINPAIASEKGFVGFLLNNYNLAAGSTVGLSNFLFKDKNGDLVTGLNKAISSETFMKKLSPVSGFVFDENLSLLTFGFWTKRDYFHNVEVNVRGYENAGIPKDLFGLLKNGESEDPYNLSKLNVSAQMYIEVAYGLSKTIGKRLSVGGRFKFLMGMANANLQCKTANFTFNGMNVAYDVDMYLRGAVYPVSIPTKQSSQDPTKRVLDYGNMSFNQAIKPSGYGAAVDLGATYKPIKGLTVSLAVLDLGAVRWTYNILGHSIGSDSFTGVKVDSGILKGESKVDDDLEEAWKKLQQLIEFEEDKDAKNIVSSEMMPITINAGARYRMPFYERLSVGALASVRTSKYFNMWEMRAGATVTPIDWFSLTANYGATNCGATFGVATSLNLASINFLLGFEGYSGKVAKYQLNDNIKLLYPINKFRYNLNFGITISFGARHRDYNPGPKKLWATGK